MNDTEKVNKSIGELRVIRGLLSKDCYKTRYLLQIDNAINLLSKAVKQLPGVGTPCGHNGCTFTGSFGCAAPDCPKQSPPSERNAP